MWSCLFLLFFVPNFAINFFIKLYSSSYNIGNEIIKKAKNQLGYTISTNI